MTRRTSNTLSLHRWLHMQHADLVDDLSGIEVEPRFDRALGAMGKVFLVLFTLFALVGAITVGNWLAEWGA